MRTYEESKIGDNLYLCSQCGAEVPGEDFNKPSHVCEECYNISYDDPDDDDDYDYDDYGDDD